MRMPVAAFLAAAISLPVFAWAASPGQTYTADQLRAFTVSGLKLGMTEAEARKAIEDGGFEGRFEKFSKDEEEVYGWSKIDQAVFPFRYRAADGSVRLWQMTFKQKFERPQSVEALKAKVVERYGMPTEILDAENQARLTYRVQYKVDHDLVGICATSIGAEKPFHCKPAEEAIYEKEIAQPIMQVTIEPTLLRVLLADQETLRAAQAANKAAADAATARKQMQNTQGTKLGM